MRFSAATTAERFLPQRLASRSRPLPDQVDALLIPRDAGDQAGRMSLIAFAIRILAEMATPDFLRGIPFGSRVFTLVASRATAASMVIGFEATPARGRS